MKLTALRQRKKIRAYTRTLATFAASYKLVSATIVSGLVIAVTGLFVLHMSPVQRSLGIVGPEPVSTVHTQPAVTEGPKLDIPQAAIENTTPTATSEGTCTYRYSDGSGNYYVAVHLANGSYKCLTYSLAELQDYTTPDINSSATRTPTKKGVFTDPDTGVTTTITQYSDGSSATTTEGEYYKLYLDRASTFYVMVNGTDMAKRFQYCMTTGYTNADGQADVRLLTPEEQAQRTTTPYPYAGPDCTAGNLPEVHYQ
jgi:hypothetical protein